MKLYDAEAGNAKRVRIFIAEKGIDVPRVVLELGKDTRSPAFLKLNSLGEVPVLELADGRVLTESVAICRYLDLVSPQKPLMGSSAFEQAHIEMWSQRVYLQIFMPIGRLVRHRLSLFNDVVEQIPAFADSQERVIQHAWRWLEGELVDGRPFIASNTFSFADVQGMTALWLADLFKLDIPDECRQLRAWAKRVRSRPSWQA